jgi:hypothetical protein
MKKYITTVMLLLAWVVQAQTASLETKNQLGKAMALFVENVKPAYQKGQTYAAFEKALLGDWNNTPEGTALLNKAFDYIVKGISSDQIANKYNGLEMANALSALTRSKSSSSDGITVFGGAANAGNSFSDKGTKETCKWYQILCFVQKASLN